MGAWQQGPLGVTLPGGQGKKEGEANLRSGLTCLWTPSPDPAPQVQGWVSVSEERVTRSWDLEVPRGISGKLEF